MAGVAWSEESRARATLILVTGRASLELDFIQVAGELVTNRGGPGDSALPGRRCSSYICKWVGKFGIGAGNAPEQSVLVPTPSQRRQGAHSHLQSAMQGCFLPVFKFWLRTPPAVGMQDVYLYAGNAFEHFL